MTLRKVELSGRALNDLREIGDWVEERAGSGIAAAYIQRLEDFFGQIALSPYRGSPRDNVRRGLRIVGFERRVTVAFSVDESRVTILRLFYGGRDWEGAFR